MHRTTRKICSAGGSAARLRFSHQPPLLPRHTTLGGSPVWRCSGAFRTTTADFSAAARFHIKGRLPPHFLHSLLSHLKPQTNRSGSSLRSHRPIGPNSRYQPNRAFFFPLHLRSVCSLLTEIRAPFDKLRREAVERVDRVGGQFELGRH